MRTSLAVACLCIMSCDSKSTSGNDRAKKKATEVVGIDPLIYKCENLVTPEDVAAVLGGTVSKAEVAFEPPMGTAEPCNYLRTYEDAQQPWSFDMDCRDDALDTARGLLEQYKKGATDAGVGAVDVGREAMDHHGQAILFIDDDTPCYVRVQGPTPEGRLALAKLIAAKLVPKTAPMRPRPVSQ